MEHAAEKPEVLQWHPAFYAGLQIELEEDRENLIFENEHQLSTKPMEIDVLVVKKEKDLPVRAERNGRWLGEKGRLAAMSAVFIGLSVF